MLAKLAALAVMFGAAAMSVPIIAQQAAHNTFSSPHVIAGAVLAMDHQRGANHKDSPPRSHNHERPIIINIFPNMAAPPEESRPRPLDFPAGTGPHRLQSPGERGPSRQPQFSPRLRPPNGKTDGKIYPA